MIIVIERFYLKAERAEDAQEVVQMFRTLITAKLQNRFHLHRNADNYREIIVQYHSERREFFQSRTAQDQGMREFCEQFCSSPPQVTVYDCYPVRDNRYSYYC